jgi:hypothetical protein
MDILRRSQQNLEAQQRAAEVEALRQQRQQEKADADAAQAIASRYVTPLATDPTSVDVAALARERFPDSQQDTRQALLGAAQTAIAQAGDKTAAGYGPGFWQAFNRVTAADGDPGKITDPAELLKLAGSDGDGALTMTGVRELLRFVDANGTVEGRAQSAMEQNFLRQAHVQIAGTQDVADPAAEARFQSFLGAYFPALNAGLKSGKSAMQLLSAASSDYLGKLVPAFTPAAAQSAADQPDAAAASGRRDKDTDTPTDDRSLWQRLLDGFAAVATGMTEEQQAARQGVNPILTRDLARRLGTLDLSQDVPMVAPDDRGILEKPEVFAPWRIVALGRDVYERVPAAEENRLASIGRVVGQGIIETPIGAAKLRGATVAAKAADAEASGTRAAETADEIATGERGVRGAGGGVGAPLSAIPRVPFPKDFPDIVIQQPRGSKIQLPDYPEYERAKFGGDTKAASDLVDAVVGESKMEELGKVIDDSKPTVVAVHSAEAGRNALPGAYAKLIGEWFGLPVDDDIAQMNRPGRTASTAQYRMMNRATFGGPVSPGQNYLLVDDNVTQGGSLSDLRSYIESKGGHVIGATTLSGGENSQILAPRPQTLEALRKNFPTLENWWEQNHGHRFDSLTESEARYLLRIGSDRTIRKELAPSATTPPKQGSAGNPGTGEDGAASEGP